MIDQSLVAKHLHQSPKKAAFHFYYASIRSLLLRAFLKCFRDSGSAISRCGTTIEQHRDVYTSTRCVTCVDG